MWEYYLTQAVPNLVSIAESRNVGPWPSILRIFLSKRNKNYSEYKLNLEAYIFLSSILYSYHIRQPYNFPSKETYTQIVTIHFSPIGFILQRHGITMETVCIKYYSHNVILTKPLISQLLPTIKHTPNVISFFSYTVNLRNNNLSAKIFTMSKY